MKLLLLTSLATACLGFGPISQSRVVSRIGSQCRSKQSLHLSSSPSPSEDSSSDNANASDGQEKSSSPSLQPIPTSQKQLDPLLRSLTRTDGEQADAPTMNVPLLGELVLDKSLFVLLPVAGFAVIGFLMSIYVGLNAGDAFVELEQAATLGKQAMQATADEGCRGICSSQEQDLEGLRTFMSNFGAKN